ELQDKLREAWNLFKERTESGEQLGFKYTDLPSEPKGNLPLILGVALFGVAAVVAGWLGWVRNSLGLGVGLVVAGLLLALIVGGVAAAYQPVAPALTAVRLERSQINEYCAHPRLDLFVDANSPHPAEKFGCTSCHGGQGSATDFFYAAHTPNNAAQKLDWKQE